MGPPYLFPQDCFRCIGCGDGAEANRTASRKNTGRKMGKAGKALTEYGIVFAVMLVFALVCHFDTIRSHFELFPGDDGDALLNVLTADSYSDVFQSRMDFRKNRMFYPYPTGRGFTDLSLTLYLLELPWRILFGAGMFSSALIVYWLLFHFGIASMFYLLRNVLHLNFMAALGGAFLAFYCNGCWVKLIHTQFFFMGLLPLLAICVIRYCQFWNSRRTLRRILFGMGAILTFAWIAYSNFFTAFFAGLAGGIYFLSYWLLSARRNNLKKLLLPQRVYELIFLALWGGLLFLPFLHTYRPLLNDNYKRTWFEAQGSLPTPADIVNIGPDNLLWGKLYDRAFPPVHKYLYENSYGIPLFTLTCLLFCFLFFLKQRKKIRPAWIALVVMAAVLYLLSLKFAHGVSLWYFIWKYVPGGSGIRAGGRIYVFLMFPLTVFLWWMLDRYSRRFSGRKQLLFCGILFAVLALDNHNTMTIYRWKPSAYAACLEAIPAPPPEMRCFFLINSAGGSPSASHHCRYGLLAWSMARRFKSFTINGYSGNVPAGFLPMDPLSPSYRKEIAQWVKRHGLTGVFSYDTATGKWQQEQF